MIDKALSFIVEEINDYLVPGGGVDAPLILGNIALHESGGESVSNQLSNKTVLSLVNMVEEASLKNGPFYRKNNDASVHYHNPTIHLNLFVLFSANMDDYGKALTELSKIVGFFQRRNSFTPELFPKLKPPIVQLIFDMHSMSFEQLNNLWSYLGGKYIPSVVYKVRLVSIQEDVRAAAPVVENIGENPNLTDVS